MKEFFYTVSKESRDLFYKVYIHKIGPFRFNWHKEIEVNIILKGKVEVCVEGKKYLLKEDESIIINSNRGHATYSKDPDSMALVFHIDPVYFKEYFKEYESLRFENIISSSNKNSKKHKIIRYLLASLLVEMRKDSTESQINSDAILPLIITNLMGAFPHTIDETDKVKKTKGQREAISKVLHYIEDMHSEKISLNEIAGMLNYNSCYVSQFFKANVGMNFYEYLTKVRVREATFELARTDHPISNIALGHGFSDIKSFNKSFKESFGRLPNEYRKEIRDENSLKRFPLKRIFVSEDDEFANAKLNEYIDLLQDNILLVDRNTSKKQEGLQEEQDIIKYENRIKELERNIEELNRKMELMRSILV